MVNFWVFGISFQAAPLGTYVDSGSFKKKKKNPQEKSCQEKSCRCLELKAPDLIMHESFECQSIWVGHQQCLLQSLTIKDTH